MLFLDLVEVLSQGCLKPDVACRKPLVYGLKGVAEIQCNQRLYVWRRTCVKSAVSPG